MAIDVQPREPAATAVHGGARRPGPVQSSPLWKRVALVSCAVLATACIVVATVRAFTPVAGFNPTFLHTVSRGALAVTAIEQGLLESAENLEIKCKVRGRSTVIWVVESGATVEPGDELVRLDSLFIEEQIDERTKYAHWSQSAADHSKAGVARSEIAVDEYQQGQFVAQLASLQKDLAIAESNLVTAKNLLTHAKAMSENGYVSELEVEEKQFSVSRAALEVEVKKTEIDVLKRFTRAERLETLKGNLAATRANHEANVERAFADASRRDRALEELKHCVVRAERGGLVIHPSAARWENAPRIAEGVRVHKDQVLLLMPDLTKMQVKIGVHESIIDRVRPGLTARIKVPNRTLDGTVASVASVTRPASWWNGNTVRYDTTIALSQEEGLAPGMSAEVEILLAHYEDVLSIPVAAIVRGEEGDFCWVVDKRGEPQRRAIQLGDTNDVFTVVLGGLREGEQVLLNPGAYEPIGAPAASEDTLEKSHASDRAADQ